MSLAESVQAARALGLTLPSPAYIVGTILFGLVGYAAWRYGKSIAHPRMRWMGAALMFYPYVVERTWLLWLVGLGICAGLWWDRPREG